MRKAEIARKTKETDISVALDLDGTGAAEISTGIGFFDHMLEQVARHGLVDLKIAAKGDLHIDGHHTVEDVGIALGQALATALGDKKGIRRYASADLPMDEALARVALDISGRPVLVWKVAFTAPTIGGLDSELVREFFHALAVNAGLTLHIQSAYGDNSHHIAESIFKGFARALRQAVEIDPRAAETIPSTKGTL